MARADTALPVLAEAALVRYPAEGTRLRSGTKVRANSSTGWGDVFCCSLQKGQKIPAGETTVSHASVRHSDTELRGSWTLPVNSQQSGRHAAW